MAAAPLAPEDDEQGPGASEEELRLAKATGEWLQLLRAALPAAIEEAKAERAARAAKAAEAASAAEAEVRKQRQRAEARAAAAAGQGPVSPATALGISGAGASSLHAAVSSRSQEVSAQPLGLGLRAAAATQPQKEEPVAAAGSAPAGEGEASGLASGVSYLLTGFDRLFSEQTPATSSGPLRFRVKVPSQYPGVQFRRSKNLADRYPKYAMNGALMKGELEDDGMWLKLSDKVYLPMHVGGVKILELERAGEAKRSIWFPCGQAPLQEEEEVMGNLEDPQPP